MKRIVMLCAAAVVAVGLSAGDARAQDCSDWSGGAVLGTLGGAALGGFIG